MENDYTIRKEVSPDLKLDKVIDAGVRRILQNRLDNFKGNAKEAFSNLDKNPIWLNQAKGIAIKRVTISGVKNAEALHTKKDHLGNDILDDKGNKIPVDFVSTGNNHHVAIYIDENGDLQEKVVSFYEAVERVNNNFSVIVTDPKTAWDKALNNEKLSQELIKNLPPENWQFQFTMKQNEYFVFPSEGFNPKEIDLLDAKNSKLISNNLFRVQKIATKDYFFRHHLETNVEMKKELNEIAYKRLGIGGLKGTIKVRINHIGQIVKVGEY